MCSRLWGNLDNGYVEERNLISVHFSDRAKGKKSQACVMLNHNPICDDYIMECCRKRK